MTDDLERNQKCDDLLQRWAESRDVQVFDALHDELYEDSQTWISKHCPDHDTDDLVQELWIRVFEKPSRFIGKGEPGWSIRLLRAATKNMRREPDRYVNRDAHNFRRRQIYQIKTLCSVTDREANRILNGQRDELGVKLTEAAAGKWITDSRERGIIAVCVPRTDATCLFDIRIQGVKDGHHADLPDEEPTDPQAADKQDETNLFEHVRSRLQPRDQQILGEWLYEEDSLFKTRTPRHVAEKLGMTPNQFSKRLMVIRSVIAQMAEEMKLWRKSDER
jgi:RNA polymerase sigma factor (sigma-70 family)